MLKLLRIDNFVLIDRVELVLDKGFTVITGETGSGKSILLAAINLLLGERADFSVIGKKSTKSFVEASFNMEDRFIDFFTANDLDQQLDIIIRREIVKDGKSRAFINDTPVQLSKLKELTSLLLSVNSQFNTFDLRSSSYQMELYDDMADTTFMRMKFTHDFLAWKTNCQVIRKLEEKRNLENSQKDYTQFLLDELSQLDLKNTDFSIYESALSRIENADSIREVALQMTHLSEDNGPYSTLSTLLSKIEKISLSDAKMTQFAAQLKAVLIELKEMMNEAEELVNDIEIDPEAHRIMLAKIDEFNRQLNKHRFTHQSQLVELENNLKDTTQESEQLDTELEQLMIENEKVHKKLVGLSQLLHENRIKAAKGIENAIKYCRNVVRFVEGPNRFYYRSAFTTNGTTFERSNNILGFPTTIVDLGPRDEFIKEICIDKNLDPNCSISRSIGPTSFKSFGELMGLAINYRMDTSDNEFEIDNFFYISNQQG